MGPPINACAEVRPSSSASMVWKKKKGAASSDLLKHLGRTTQGLTCVIWHIEVLF